LKTNLAKNIEDGWEIQRTLPNLAKPEFRGTLQIVIAPGEFQNLTSHIFEMHSDKSLVVSAYDLGGIRAPEGQVRDVGDEFHTRGVGPSQNLAKTFPRLAECAVVWVVSQFKAVFAGHLSQMVEAFSK
jgi:hypothetical protein